LGFGGTLTFFFLFLVSWGSAMFRILWGFGDVRGCFLVTLRAENEKSTARIYKGVGDQRGAKKKRFPQGKGRPSSRVLSLKTRPRAETTVNKGRGAVGEEKAWGGPCAGTIWVCGSFRQKKGEEGETTRGKKSDSRENG